MLFDLISTIIVAVISIVIVPMIKQSVQINRRQEIVQMVNIMVAAAEQTMKTNTGAEKKAQVEEWLKEKGIDPEDCKLIIEKAVYELNKIDG